MSRRMGTPGVLGVLFLVGVGWSGLARAQSSGLPGLVRSHPYTDDELKELQLLPKLVRLYEWGTKVFLAISDQIVERTYANERQRIQAAYKGPIEKTRRSVEARRLEAIKQFEAWVKRYPNDKRWTPDVLFRLAELYYEKATVDFQYAQVEYRETVKRLRERSNRLGRELPEPPEPQIDYSVPISYYKRIIREFPHYENIDVVYYLLGYCLREMAKQAEEVATEEEEPGKPSRARILAAQARQAFLGLVCANRYKPLDPPKEPEIPPELEPLVSGSEEEAAAAIQNIDLGKFDPYRDCKPVVPLSRFHGRARKKREALLSQAWFVLGEQHFDADPIVTLSEQEKEQLKQEFMKHRDKEQYVNDYQRLLAEKKERKIKIHNYYAISAYTRVIDQFPKSEEYSDALYKRAWTYFRVNLYKRALDEFDRLLLTSKDQALRDNAVRYVALCAYYQRESDDKFQYLLNHYRQKGWLYDPTGPKGKYRHVKRAFVELAKIFFEDAAPPPDTPGPENYNASDLLQALRIYRWILKQAGFGPDQPGEHRDWKYFKERAEVQKGIIDALYLLTINNEVQKNWPRRLYHDERRQAFNRFSPFDTGPTSVFARKYEKMWGEDPEVRKALSFLRQTSLLEVANEYYILGRQLWEKKQAEINALIQEIAKLNQRLSEARGKGDQEEAARLQSEVQARQAKLAEISKEFEKWFKQAIAAYNVLIDHPRFKDTMDAYKALYYRADCYFYLGDYLKAAEAYKEAAESKISNRFRLQALRGRVDSLLMYNELHVVPPLPPSPDRTKEFVARPIPDSVKKWHEAMLALLEAEENKQDAANFEFRIAMTYYQYGHRDEAYRRLWDYLKKHCDTTNAFYAAQALLAIALIENNRAGGTLESLKKLDEERQKLAAAKCGTNVTFPPKTPKKDMEAYAAKVRDFYKKMLGLAADIRMNRADALYREARRAKGSMQEEKYLAAARELEEIARKYPDSPKAAVSLYYAAEGYEATKRFRKAKALYEEILRNPKYRQQMLKVKDEVCEQVGGKERCREVVSNKLDNVVNFLAQAAWRAMEFQQAMQYYGMLVAGKVPVDEPVIRVNAYYWYARLLRMNDRPREAVRYYLKYYRDIGKVIADLRRKVARAKTAEERRDYEAALAEAERFRVEVFYDLGKIAERLNDLRGMEEYYGRYIDQVARRLAARPTGQPDFYRKNRQDRRAAMQMMEALHKLATAYRNRGRARRATEYEKRIVEYFDRFNMPKGENPAADYAAAIAFRQVEGEFQTFLRRKLAIRAIRLKTKLRKGMKVKPLLAVMCELMGWGVNRKTGKPCAPGKALGMLAGVVNPYVAEVNRLTDKFYNDVGTKYLHPRWILAVRARIGQMYVKAAQDLEGLPVPPEVKKFWKIFWAFVQKYKAIPKYRAFFEKLLEPFGLDMDDEEVDEDTILEAYKETTFGVIRKNAKLLRDRAIFHFLEGLKLAREKGMASKWTDVMKRGLADIDADRFPYVHDAKVAR